MADVDVGSFLVLNFIKPFLLFFTLMCSAEKQSKADKSLPYLSLAKD